MSADQFLELVGFLLGSCAVGFLIGLVLRRLELTEKLVTVRIRRIFFIVGLLLAAVGFISMSTPTMLVGAGMYLLGFFSGPDNNGWPIPRTLPMGR